MARMAVMTKSFAPDFELCAALNGRCSTTPQTRSTITSSCLGRTSSYSVGSPVHVA